jgi:hypothetical protein
MVKPRPFARPTATGIAGPAAMPVATACSRRRRRQPALGLKMARRRRRYIDP